MPYSPFLPFLKKPSCHITPRIPITQFATHSRPSFVSMSVFSQSAMVHVNCGPHWYYSLVAQGEPSVRLADKPCLFCPAGYASNAPDLQVDLACTHCAAGTFKERTGFDPCVDCAYGTFSGVASLQCCSVGKSLSNATGECEACLPGEKWAGGTCEPCAAGSYGSGEGYVPAMK